MLLSVFETVAIQEEIGCTVAQLRDEVFGVEVDPETAKTRMTLMTDPKKMKKLGTLIRILGNAGLEENGLEADLTDKWVLRHMKPAMFGSYVVTVLEEINSAMLMEARNQEQNGPVDEILEEQNRKKEQGS